MILFLLFLLFVWLPVIILVVYDILFIDENDQQIINEVESNYKKLKGVIDEVGTKKISNVTRVNKMTYVKSPKISFPRIPTISI